MPATTRTRPEVRLMAGVHSKLEDQSRIPKSFRGVPIVLLAAAIMSLSFMGFGGMFS